MHSSNGLFSGEPQLYKRMCLSDRRFLMTSPKRVKEPKNGSNDSMAGRDQTASNLAAYPWTQTTESETKLQPLARGWKSCSALYRGEPEVRQDNIAARFHPSSCLAAKSSSLSPVCGTPTTPNFLNNLRWEL